MTLVHYLLPAVRIAAPRCCLKLLSSFRGNHLPRVSPAAAPQHALLGSAAELSHQPLRAAERPKPWLLLLPDRRQRQLYLPSSAKPGTRRPSEGGDDDDG